MIDEAAERIMIASQPAHALKARVYLRRLRPDLADKLTVSGDYRCGESVWLKPVLAVYGLWTLRSVRREIRSLAS